MMNIGYLLPPLITVGIGIFLLIIVLSYRPKEQSHWFLSLILTIIVVWALIIFAMRSSPDVERALFWDRIVIAFVFAVPLLYYHFSLILSDMRGLRSLLYVGYFFLIAILAITPTDLLVQRMELTSYGYAPILGTTMLPIVVFAYLLGIMAIYNLFGAYRISGESRKKKRLLYIMLAMFFPIIGATFEVFPTIYPTAIFGNIVFCLFTTAAILKYNLLNIQVIIRKSLYYTLISALVAIPYVGMLVLLQLFLGIQEWWINVLVLLLFAVLLKPLFDRLQKWVDRVFYRERYDYLVALERFCHEAQSITNFEEISSRVVKLVRGALLSSSVCLLLPSEGKGDLVLVSHAGLESSPPPITLRESSMLVRWFKIHFNILSSKELSVVTQLQSLSSTNRSALEKMNGELYVPIRTRDGGLAGLLVLGERLSQQSYTDEEIKLLEALSSQLSINLENARLYSDIVREVAERENMEGGLQQIEKLESIGTLAGGIAHDFNNILTGIMGNISLAMRHMEPGSKAEQRLREAQKASLRAQDLTQQLLTFSKGGMPIKKPLLIAKLLEEASVFALRGSNIKCKYSITNDPLAVDMDEGQMNQVITNLVINAKEAMPDGGMIEVGMKNTSINGISTLPLSEGNYVEVTVKDHGIGIAKEHLDRIFDPFLTTKKKGSGLGLTTSYSIIKNHNGYITVESELGVGTTFHIYLPVSNKLVPTKTEGEVLQSVSQGRGRILVMDDEEMIREMLSDMLSYARYEVELAVDGAQAVDRFKQARDSERPFDVVILDLTVPGGMGGIEAIKKLLEIDSDVLAIVSSGYSADPIMSEYKKYGFSAVVAKPYSSGDLETALQRLLARSRRRG